MMDSVDLSALVAVISEANDQTKLVAAGVVILLGTLLSIALVVMLYKRVDK